MTIALTAGITFLVTVLAGLALDYLRHVRPRITYSVKDAVPIDLDGKRIGAYLVSLSNLSNRVVKNVSCHIQAPPATLRNGGVSVPQGLQYAAVEKDNGMQLSIPYLKPGDELQATVIAEAFGYIPSTPDVAIRSPQDINVTASGPGVKPPSFQRGFLTAAVVATFVAGAAAAVLPFSSDALMEPNDVFAVSASLAGLPHLTEVYSTSSNIHYYNQGDVAFALAAESSDPAEIRKYRHLISLVLDTAPSMMMSQSRASLYYSLGKIDLLLDDRNGAIQDFRHAIDSSKSTVNARSKVDLKVRDFLVANGLS
jgi:hypothetical protein